MKKSKEKISKIFNRREFLLGSTIGLGCLSVGLKEALAQIAITRKPLLTEKSLNNLIRGATGKTAVEMAKEAKSDLIAFLNKHFTLTKGQKQYLEKMQGTKERNEILDAIDNFLKTNKKFKVKIIQPDEKIHIKKTVEIEW